jgi:hypothetical protein
MSSVAFSISSWPERRASQRLSVEIPATLRVRSHDYTAKMLNVVHGGAMLESSAPAEVNSRVALRCGTVVVDATVVWSDAGRVGINFVRPLTDAQVREQVARSTALAAYRQSKQQS